MTRYRLAQLHRYGLLGQVRPGQLLVALAGLLGAIIAIDAAPSAPGAIAGTLALAAAAAIATTPVYGRALDEWAPIAASWALARITGRSTHLSTVPTAGTSVPLGRHAADRLRSPQAVPAPPPALNGVRLTSIPYRERTIGAISERRGRFLTAVLVCRAPGLALLDDAEQEHCLHAWGEVLSSTSRVVRRIQWVQRTAPAHGDELARWLHEQRDREQPLSAPAPADYLELMQSTAHVAEEHEVLISVQVDRHHLTDASTGSLERNLIEQAERIATGLRRARVTIRGALGVGQLARVLRTGFDPYCRHELAAVRAAGANDEPGEAGAWPIGAAEGWGSYQADGALHATYVVERWPRADVGPLFLSPLLESSGRVRSVAVVFAPIEPERSIRDAEAELTREASDRALRRRLGQIDTERARQAAEATTRREAELAVGHAEVRIAGYVTVSGHDRDDLRRACEDMTERAARAHLTLRRMYGQQPEAFTFTLPLCRGLR